jgi:bifunctional DNA-binding transcriptional regulator/antitoxin component of YhaV-PrlF toxin-antitoxin module
MKMAEFSLIPIPTEDCDALGINKDTILETYVTDDGALIIRVVSDEDMSGLVCNSDCGNCPADGSSGKKLKRK